MKLKYQNLTIRQAEIFDAKQLAAWWNDGAVMAHAGFPNGLGTTVEEVAEGLENSRMVIEESDRLIGECIYRNVADGVAEIGIKICETDCQNRGVGRKVLSMLIRWLFETGYSNMNHLVFVKFEQILILGRINLDSFDRRSIMS